MLDFNPTTPKEEVPPYTPRLGYSSPSPSTHSTPSGSKRSMLPTLRLALPYGALTNEKEPILPLTTSPTRRSMDGRGMRSASRRLSYTIKSRAGHYALPLLICGFFLASIYTFLCWSHHPMSYSIFRSRTEHHWVTKGDSSYHEMVNEFGFEGGDGHPTTHRVNGISVLSTEDELIAEDDLFWEQYHEPAVHEPTAQEAADMAEFAAHELDVRQREARLSLMALIWWLAEGGRFPAGWTAPAQDKVDRMKSADMEKTLDRIDSGEDGSAIFEEGWAEFAEKRFRVVVFSKSYCPYSKNAKSILADYHLVPAAFVIELDRRRDGAQIQDLLKALTGRRTVPNVVIDFESIGGSDEITLFHSEGGLQRKLDALDLVPGSRRRKGFRPVKADDMNQRNDRGVAREAKNVAADDSSPKGGAQAKAGGEVMPQREPAGDVVLGAPEKQAALVQQVPAGDADADGRVLQPVRVKRGLVPEPEEETDADEQQILDAPFIKRAVLPANRQVVDQKGDLHVARIRPESENGIAAMVDAVRMAKPKDRKVTDLYQ